MKLLPVDGWPGYFVGDDGHVYSARYNKGTGDRLRRRRPGRHRSGHLMVCLSGRVPRKTFTVHRLVCAAFNGPCPPGMECRHLDGNPANNVPSNLRWGTCLENKQDMIRHDRSVRGTRNPNAKLGNGEVMAIKILLAAGLRGSDVATRFGVSHGQICNIRKGIRWKHVG